MTACGRDLNKWKGILSPVWENTYGDFLSNWMLMDRCKSCEKKALKNV